MPHLSHRYLVGILADCNCTGTINSNSTKYICGDARLGPVILPKKAPFSHMFLRIWTSNGSYNYPGHETQGFQLSTINVTIAGEETLVEGMLLDRFGGVHGMFLAPTYTPFAQRSLPPSALNDPEGGPTENYHVYKVERNFTVLSGTTAAWFGQPGQGTQYWYNGTVEDLISAKNLSVVAV
ncbi:hypothetical protein B0H13DRAFT_2240589 [Mycena leptocephala]|nr:hypothetical protein B0H13DRAFT_2240589 [Mycena leptocephala]